MIYRWWLLAHLAGVVAFLGTFVLAFSSKALAERSGTASAVAHAFGVIRFGDRWIMPPSVTLILVSGLALSLRAGLSPTATGWILWPAVLLGVSGLIFLLRVGPLQERLERLARSAPDTLLTEDRYQRMASAWQRWAFIAFASNLAAMALMVLKPAVPGV